MNKFKKISKRRLGIITSENGKYKSFRVVIPMRFVRKLGWTSGQKIVVKLSGKHVTLWNEDINDVSQEKDKV